MMSRAARTATVGAGLSLAVALTGAGLEARAASATGSASATVIGDIASLPITIRFQASPVELVAGGVRVRLTDDRSGPGAGSAFGVTLIGVDETGLASFSIAGATTSSYVVRTSAAETSGPAGLAPDGASPNRAEAGLIYPAEVLAEGQGISIAVSQSGGSPRELTVMVHYN